MRRFGIILLTMLTGCGILCPKPVPSSNTYVGLRDSIAIHESILQIPLEKSTNIALPRQRSHLETSLAISDAYTDSLGMIHHSIENKKGAQFIYKEKIKYRDSIQIKEIPIPYEVIKEKEVIPKVFWISMIIAIVSILYICLKIYLKFRK